MQGRGGRPRQGLTARPLRGQTDDRAFHTAAASRRSPCAAATPHGALRGREAFGVRPRAGAIWGTATVPRSATRLRMVCTPAGSVAQSTALSLGYPASSPARGGCTRTGGICLKILKASKLRLQSSFPLQPPRWPVAGREAKPASESVGPLERAQFTFSTTLRIRAICAGRSRGKVEGSGAFVGPPVAGAQKVKCAMPEKIPLTESHMGRPTQGRIHARP